MLVGEIFKQNEAYQLISEASKALILTAIFIVGETDNDLYKSYIRNILIILVIF